MFFPRLVDLQFVSNQNLTFIELFVYPFKQKWLRGTGHSGYEFTTKSPLNVYLFSFSHHQGCQLSTDKPAVSWSVDQEDGDRDFLTHTLFLKNVGTI